MAELGMKLRCTVLIISQSLNHTAPDDTIFCEDLALSNSTSGFLIQQSCLWCVWAAHELGTQDFYRRIHELELIITEKLEKENRAFFFHFHWNLGGQSQCYFRHKNESWMELKKEGRLSCPDCLLPF